MNFPVYLHLGSLRVHFHAVFEFFAYAVGFRVYLWMRRRDGDALNDANRWWVIAAAAMGALLGSRMLYWLEDPRLTLAHWSDPAFLFGGKTIVGALIGALFAVELTKHLMGITRRTGDLFAVPLCAGITIGRIGCFLTGPEDHTAGTATSLPWGINFGDGIARHPTQLYEIIFAIGLGLFLWRCMKARLPDGEVFKIFMVGYFTFRLACDFLKPDVRVLLGMSAIQWACLLMLVYYAPDVARWVRYSSRRPIGKSGGAIKNMPQTEILR